MSSPYDLTKLANLTAGYFEPERVGTTHYYYVYRAISRFLGLPMATIRREYTHLIKEHPKFTVQHRAPVEMGAGSTNLTTPVATYMDLVTLIPALPGKHQQHFIKYYAAMTTTAATHKALREAVLKQAMVISEEKHKQAMVEEKEQHLLRMLRMKIKKAKLENQLASVTSKRGTSHNPIDLEEDEEEDYADDERQRSPKKRRRCDRFIFMDSRIMHFDNFYLKPKGKTIQYDIYPEFNRLVKETAGKMWKDKYPARKAYTIARGEDGEEQVYPIEDSDITRKAFFYVYNSTHFHETGMARLRRDVEGTSPYFSL